MSTLAWICVALALLVGIVLGAAAMIFVGLAYLSRGIGSYPEDC